MKLVVVTIAATKRHRIKLKRFDAKRVDDHK
jgi:hypothetical protein